jgi:outer membrane protein TolC
MRQTPHNYSKPKSHFPNPFAPYTATNVPAPSFANAPRLDQLVRDGKIYLSLSDAIALALENNYDIAIQRYNLDIADTDILRAKAGSGLRGVGAGIVEGTIGGASPSLVSGGGPGGTSLAVGGAGAGAAGQVLSTNGAGPLPEYRDPVITGQFQGERANTPTALGEEYGCPVTNTVTNVAVCNQNTNIYNVNYTEGFSPGTQLTVAFNNQYVTSNSYFELYSPSLTSTFTATITQHLLQGRGFFINNRFIIEAKRNRQITDSAFRQQVLYTVNQVENIYWGLVGAYEDVLAKQQALDQSQRLAADNRKQVQIGTLAPLDVVNADASVASDQQNLVSAQTTLEYQQLIMKQAIARNLSDPVLSSAPVVPTDRVSLEPVPEESEPVETLVQQAFVNRPEIEQGQLNMKNAELTIKALKNGLLPTLDVYGFYGASATGGTQSPNCETYNAEGELVPCPPNTVPTVGYGSVFSNLFNSSGPNKGAGVNLQVTLRNRTAQADQARSQLEYRQAEMRLAQSYVQVRIQVINAQYALTQDRAQVQSARAAQNFAQQSLDAENKKYSLGASTTALVLQQKRNLASAQNTLLAAQTAYARDRATLSLVLANTLDKYGINLASVASDKVDQLPVVPGLIPATQEQEQVPVPATQQPLPTDTMPQPPPAGQ